MDIMNTKYEILLFDIDNTLLNFDIAEESSLVTTLLKYGLTPNNTLIKEFKVINNYYWMEYEKGTISKEELLRRRFKDFFSKNLVNNINEDEVNKFYLNELSNCSVLMPNALEILKLIKEKTNIKIYVVTNGVYKTQMGRLNKSPILEYIDDIFISEILGVQKPKKEFFDIVFSKINNEIGHSKVLLIGDSLTADIIGGINYGLDTCWYNPHNLPSELKITYRIKDLMEIWNIIKK